MEIKKKRSFISLMFKRRSIKEILKKNIEIVLGYPLYGLSFLIPRKKNKWLIGSHIGFGGNPKFFFLKVVNEYPERSCYWITATLNEKQQLKDLGLPVYYRWSLKGIYHSLTAGVYIFGFHLIDINFWTSGRARRVNLWHGVGIKNIEFKSTKGSAGKIYNEKSIISRLYFPYLFKRPHLFLSTSSLMTEHFKQCFRITNQECIESTYPRCDIFNWETKRLNDFIKKYESIESIKLIERLQLYKKTYLYMPTWRETRENFVVSAGFDFSRLNDVLRENKELFLLKLHPESNLQIENITKYTNIIILDKKIDIYPILPFTDVLITDYSSIYYDYLLIKGKDTLLFPFDYSEYITEGRDFAFDFDKYTPGKRVFTFEELLSTIQKKEVLQFAERTWITEQFWNQTYPQNDLFERITSLK